MGPCTRPTDGKLRARGIHICSPHRIWDQKDHLSTHSPYIFLSNNHRGSNPPAWPNPKQKEKALLRYSFFFICCIIDYFYVTPHCPELFPMLQCGIIFRSEREILGLPGDPVVKTLHFQCRGCRFDP